MSKFVYNDIVIPYAFHTDFSQEAIYDPSGTDRMYTKFDLTVQGVLNSSLNTITGVPDGQGANAAAIMQNIRGKLLEPRKHLTVDFGELNLLPSADGVDAKNGPLPQACNIQRLTTTTFLISYRIITHRVEGAGGETGGNPVVSIRWRDTQNIDDKMFTTRIRQGSFTIRSDNLEKLQADELRSRMAILAIPNGFMRESSEYTISEDGLTLSFTIRDKETWLYPPFPAYKATGRYQETSTKVGAMRRARCSCTLEGGKNSANADLIEAAVKVCATKLFTNGGGQAPIVDGKSSPQVRLHSCVIDQDLYENRVSCTMEANLNPWQFGNPQNTFHGVDGINFSKLAVPPAGSEAGAQKPFYFDYGTAGRKGTTPYQFAATLLLAAAQYFDPAVAGVILNKQTGQLSAGEAIGTGGDT